MGNTASNPQSHPNHRTQSPIRRGSPARAPSITNPRVHRSLRQKKKSLELPDLASLALTPASSSPAGSPHGAYRRPTSPIPIPISAPIQPTFRPQNNLPSAAHLAFNGRNNSRYERSYMNVYPSTRSFISRPPEHSPPREEPPRSKFVPEIVHSTLPLALVKAEEELSNPEPVQVKIVYRGAGQSVILTRAGDDNWQGRQPMQFDGQWFTYVSLLPGTHHLKFIVDDQIRISEDYPQAVDDRDGSLANYVSVPVPSSTVSHAVTAAAAAAATAASGPTVVSPLASPTHQHPPNVNSFWSDASSNAGEGGSGHERGEPEWTTEIPTGLIAAAAEEEVYLQMQETASHDMSSNSSASGYNSVPTPNIPPAPVLPRHLDKLILNVKPQTVSGSPVPTERDRSRRSGRERSKRERDREGRARSAHLGMSMTTGDMNGDAPGDGGVHGPSPLGLPVVTASGTDVTSAVTTPDLERLSRVPVKLDVAGLADDASVLPVPSHVVLHHLSTSAIRNGVLAVANTTRYRKKYSQYITTIYYKPT
ncbi:carbohydrate-binding module family 48 protein [Daedalea quercina L-15889]|uniref:Carbohydrate-binding module family 48 protein n=1 Tax=Daedalea quercina L-15889 TaxID=1314783 RepID=A0A165TTY4_9APHY|nr:carbohydrate-binding module family 48 protein [Daedalea quercina L-15889]